ncbi:hypothetical protein Poli38472_000722 [Pythium oligandrum]|uniref:Uncharacterized protein n=1 Tax=Pythium oligandrum TaxID=41045 RepID=A0A8K1CD97_PYTOL|nr:hypothetical protein Poli38472_000722 [Pythium oligandrum]|eukprot:TMW60680.1 hypothetical protein Poli38472_000722 [Pythium oligandrum]
MATGVELNDALLRRYNVAKNLVPQEEEERDAAMTAISFHQQGDVCVTSRNDGVVSVINCLSGMITKTIFTKRYGVDLIKYTHHPDCILFSSMNDANDFRIRYHSVFDNKFLRYYSGHTNRVTSLMMHPTADEFLTASLDGTIRLWDVRCADTVALIRTDHMPVNRVCAAYDQEGVVFGVYTDDHLIRMYDARNYQEGPFAKFSLYDNSILRVLEPHLAQLQAENLNIKKLHAVDIKFSPDGNQLLVTTNRGVFLHLDAFEGHLLHMFHQHASSQTASIKLGAAYTPDGMYVTTGSEDGHVFVYRAATGELVHKLPRGHQGDVTDLQWNPQRHLLGSVGGNSTVLWTPGAI